MIHVLPHTPWFTFCPIRHGCRFAPYALKGQKLLAQGSALGNTDASLSPCKGKSFQIPGNMQSRLQPLFEPVLHAGSQQGFEILDGLLNLRFLSLDLLYALGKEVLEGERWEDDREVFNVIFV